jgi:hypothetical protein
VLVLGVLSAPLQAAPTSSKELIENATDVDALHSLYRGANRDVDKHQVLKAAARRAAEGSIARDDAVASEMVREALADEGIMVVRAGIVFSGAVESARSVGSLVSLYRTAGKKHPNAVVLVRCDILQALGEIGSPRAVSFLHSVLSERTSHFFEPEVEYAIDALVRIGNRRSAAELSRFAAKLGAVCDRYGKEGKELYESRCRELLAKVEGASEAIAEGGE